MGISNGGVTAVTNASPQPVIFLNLVTSCYNSLSVSVTYNGLCYLQLKQQTNTNNVTGRARLFGKSAWQVFRS